MSIIRVSVITAVFNGESSIASTLSSVAAQDYPAIEHILIDGCSSDSTVDRIKQFAGPHAEFISETDTGVYDAFNKGLRRARGDVIAYLNSGDTYTSVRVVSQMVEALSAKGVGAAFADVLIVDRYNMDRVIRRYSSKRFSPAVMAYGIMPAHPSLFLRREIYRGVGEYSTDFRIAGDFELCLRVFVTHDTSYVYLNEAIVRMPDGGLSNRGWRSKFLITQEMRKACHMNGVRSNFAKLCLRFPLKVLELI